jgi:hypothetical protein
MRWPVGRNTSGKLPGQHGDPAGNQTHGRALVPVEQEPGQLAESTPAYVHQEAIQAARNADRMAALRERIAALEVKLEKLSDHHDDCIAKMESLSDFHKTIKILLWLIGLSLPVLIGFAFYSFGDDASSLRHLARNYEVCHDGGDTDSCAKSTEARAPKTTETTAPTGKSGA